MALKALILAIDGVLAETHEARRETYNDVFKEAGVDWYWDRGCYAKLLRSTDGNGMIRAFVTTELSRRRHPGLLSTMIDAMNRRHAALFHERIRRRAIVIRPGMTPLLCCAASAGMRLAIATQENEEDVIALLDAAFSPDMVAMFEIFASSAAQPAHQEPAHLRAVRQLALTPQKCLVVESSTRGLKQAHALGIPVVFTWGTYPQLQDCGEVLCSSAETTLTHASGVIIGRWDCASAPDLLDHLREIHAAQVRTARSGQEKQPDPRSFQEREVNYAGLGHLEA